LSVVNWKECVDGFNLDDDCSGNDKVHPVSRLDLDASELNRKLDLFCDGNRARFECEHEALFVGGLKKTRAERFVYLDRRGDDLRRQVDVTIED
jgi:hypothetical protein